MVSTDIPIAENQLDWLKGVDTEATVKNHIRQMLQNFKKASIYHKIVRRRTIWVTEFRLQFLSFFAHQDKKSKAIKHYKEDTVEKVYREHLPI